jgi:hypothetical protein
MVGSFSKANTSACVASRTEGVEPPSQHETKWRQSIQLPWSCSRSDTARRQPSEQSTSGWMQAKQPPLSGEQGRIFILTSPLIGFLGRLRSRRACLRFTDRDQNALKWSCRSRIPQRTANMVLTVCVSEGDNPTSTSTSWQIRFILRPSRRTHPIATG